MKKPILLIIIFIFWLNLPAAATGLIARPEKTVRPGGLTVIFWPMDNSRLTTLSLWVRAGSFNETDKNSGISHLIEHLIFKGTYFKDAAEISQQVESLGGNFNGFTTTDFTCYHITLPGQLAIAGCDILLDMVRHPLFSLSDIENEKKVVTEEIIRQDESPDYFIKRNVQGEFFGRHPYGRPVSGTGETVAGLSRGDIIGYYNYFYQPENMVLVVTGSVDSSGLNQLIEKYFPETKKETLPPGIFSFSVRPPVLPAREKTIRISKPVSQTYLLLALPAPAVTSRDSVIMDVILKVLSGGESGRLTRAIREKDELVTHITTSFNTRKAPGFLTIEAVLKEPARPDAAVSAIKEEIKNLSSRPISADELEKAKDQARTEYLLNTETSFEKAFILGYFESINSYLYGLNYLEEIDRVTPADILKAAGLYLSRPAIIGILEPENQTQPEPGDTA